MPWSSLTVCTNNLGNSSGKFIIALTALADLLLSLSTNLIKYSPLTKGVIKEFVEPDTFFSKVVLGQTAVPSVNGECLISTTSSSLLPVYSGVICHFIIASFFVVASTDTFSGSGGKRTVLVEGLTGEDLVQEVSRNLADSGRQLG